MKRKLLNVASALSAALLVVVSISWTASYWREQAVIRRVLNRTLDRADQDVRTLAVNRGGIIVLRQHVRGTDDATEERGFRPPNASANTFDFTTAPASKQYPYERQMGGEAFRLAGFQLVKNRQEEADYYSQSFWYIVVPCWAAVVVLAVLPGFRAAQWVRALTAGSPRDRCPACGYDLRATPDRCPECGTPVTSTLG